MPLDAIDYQALITTQVGDIQTEKYPTGVLATTITSLWTLNETKPTDELRYLYTKRSAIETLMGIAKDQVTLAGNDRSIDLSDKIKNLQLLLKNVDSEIAKAEEQAQRDIEQRAQTNRGPQVGHIRATSCTPIRPGAPHPLDPRYR